MALTAGTKLGQYEVVESIGAGGMGEVYRATDTKLGRDVAIKVLPEAFAADPERLKRFEREARVLASLNHPNIAAIYGLDEDASTHFLVLELVEGEDLSERLKRGSIPVDEALDIARQIAEALEEAHDKGVIHRDLKPGNIKLTPDGKVKVLDFGLAKAFDSDLTTKPDSSQSPTMSRQATMAGVILGTAGYMSPEQARGKPVDKRADLWALGVVLFEMLSGKRLFESETISDTLAAVLRADVDWKALPRECPSSAQRLLRRCLARDPKSRLRDAGDARLELVEAEWGSVEHATTTRSSLLPWSLAAALVLALVASFVMRGGSTETKPVLRVDIAPPDDTEFVWLCPPALSPEGSKLAFVGRDAEEVERIYVRGLASGITEALSGTENASFPFWSPDGEWLGFFAERKLKKIRAAGGDPVELADVVLGRGGTWSQEGVIVFSPAAGGALLQVADSGGNVRPVTEVGAWGEDVFSHRHPSFLPDGQHFLYIANTTTGYANAGVLIGSLDSLEPEFIMNGVGARYASGHLLVVRGQTLMAQGFDLETCSLTGESVRLVQSILQLRGAATGAFTVSESGELVYALGEIELSRLQWVDREGRLLEYSGEPGRYSGVTVSPDGRWALLAQADEAGGGYDLNLWLYDITSEVRTRLTFDAGFDMWPLWAPDSTAMVYASVRDDGVGLYRQSIASAGTEERLFGTGMVRLIPSDWSPDGGSIVFSNDSDLWILALEDGSEPHPFVESEHREALGAFSPDGRWIAYVSDEMGRNEIFATSFPEPGRKWQVSTEGAEILWWREDEILYQDAAGVVRSRAVDTRGETLRLGKSRELFRGPPPSVEAPRLSPSPGADRFLLVNQVNERSTDPLTLVVNWPATLAR